MIRLKPVTLIGLALIAGMLVGCDSDTPTAAIGEGLITGKVYDSYSAQSLADVTIQAQTIVERIDEQSDAGGSYTLRFKVDSTLSVAVRFSKGGYRDTLVTVNLRSGGTSFLDVRMTPTSVVTPTGPGTGIPQTIAFVGADPTEISVYGVGGKETSILRWEVRDSLGIPIDAAHADTIFFSSINGPNGGEYISPSFVITNAAGQAATTLNAGIRSGVVQVLARIHNTAGRTIISSPVQVVIRGGFPVQARFTISAPYYNFPALNWVGRTLPVSVLVGDVYSNPVAAGTAVYFRSSAGVVQPTVFTSADGGGSVSLISGNPQPTGAYASVAYGDGYHYLVARTLGQGGTAVQDSVLILWSGVGSIKNVTSTGALPFNISNMSSQSFSFEVSDQLGHPLAAGTNISVTAVIPPPPSPGQDQNQVFVSFGNNGSLTLGDVIFPGPGSTQFTFELRDGTWAIDENTVVNLTITVSGPNLASPVTYALSGVVR